MTIQYKGIVTFLISITTILIFIFQSIAIAETNVTIGTGGISGIYYPTGMNICSMVNVKPVYKISCYVVSTGGSIFNINSVLSGTLEFGIAQSDRNFEAWNGLGFWEAAGPRTDLRSIFSIHKESITLIAGSDSGINSITDLSGKIVNIGSSSSGERQHAIKVMDYFGIDFQTDITATEFNLTDAFIKFHDYEIDAIFLIRAHPSTMIYDQIQGARQVYFVPIVNVEDFLASYSYYVSSRIPIYHYPHSTNTSDVQTIGVKATFVTSASMTESIVYAFAKEVFGNFRSFQIKHPTYETLTKDDMLQGLTAPIHPGAIKYLEEDPSKECPGDIDKNGVVDGSDLAGMPIDFGNTECETP